MSVNKVILLGRLGQNPELKHIPSGQGVCTFPIATSEAWTDKSGQKQEKTEWHRIVVWGKLAELCNQYLSKGRQVFVEGKLQTRSWDDKNGGKRYSTEILANTVQFLGSSANANTSANESRPTENSNSDPSETEFNISTDSNFAADDIPF